LFAACKKSEQPVKEPIVEPTPPANATTKYDGLFVTNQFYQRVNADFVFKQTQSSAYISSQTIVDEAYNLDKLMDLGQVSLNGRILKNQTNGRKFQYQDTTFSLISNTAHWKVAGASPIDSFSFVNTKAAPSFTPLTLPDTLFISKGFFVTLKPPANCTNIRLFISGGSNYVNKFFKGDETNLGFTADELKGELLPGTGNFYTLTFYNDNLWNINKRIINFRHSATYSGNSLVIKP